MNFLIRDAPSSDLHGLLKFADLRECVCSCSKHEFAGQRPTHPVAGGVATCSVSPQSHFLAQEAASSSGRLECCDGQRAPHEMEFNHRGEQR